MNAHHYLNRTAYIRNSNGLKFVKSESLLIIRIQIEYFAIMLKSSRGIHIEMIFHITFFQIGKRSMEIAMKSMCTQRNTAKAPGTNSNHIIHTFKSSKAMNMLKIEFAINENNYNMKFNHKNVEWLYTKQKFETWFVSIAVIIQLFGTSASRACTHTHRACDWTNEIQCFVELFRRKSLSHFQSNCSMAIPMKYCLQSLMERIECISYNISAFGCLCISIEWNLNFVFAQMRAHAVTWNGSILTWMEKLFEKLKIVFTRIPYDWKILCIIGQIGVMRVMNMRRALSSLWWHRFIRVNHRVHSIYTHPRSFQQPIIVQNERFCANIFEISIFVFLTQLLEFSRRLFLLCSDHW